jgi:hypothetical protein
MSDNAQAGARPATSHRLAASALLAAASPIAHTANWRTCSTRVAPHALAAPLGRPACRRLPPFSDQALIPIVGNAQEHAFHELPPRLARSDAHTRRRPEVEDEQWISATTPRSRWLLYLGFFLFTSQLAKKLHGVQELFNSQGNTPLSSRPYPASTPRSTTPAPRRPGSRSLLRTLRCHTRFYKENRMHLTCAPGSFYTHMIDKRV